jgi:ferritin-like metal-binding protein YciE
MGNAFYGSRTGHQPGKVTTTLEVQMSEKTSVNALLEDEIKDLYSAERQLTRALPKMAKGATHPGLQTALRAHLKETQNQVTRLEAVAKLLEINPGGK